MKIAIITETFLPSTDGIVTRLCASIRWLLNEGHEVLVIAPDLGTTAFEGAEVKGVPPRSFFFYRDKKFAFPHRKVRRYLQDFEPDVVHVVNPVFLGVAGIYYARRGNWPLVASYHTHLPKYADHYHVSFLKPLFWWYFRLLHNRADVNLCTSQSVHSELEDQRFQNVKVWKRGVDTDRFHPGHYNEGMREWLTGGEQSKTLLLFVGRLAAEKEIEKIREVLDQSSDVCLAIVGDGPHRSVLEKYFQGTNTVFTGLLHGEELASAYASSDIFVFPSTTETLGLVLLEAMASGLPVVAAESGPTKEQVEDGVTGMLYNPEDRKDFVDKVLALNHSSFRDGVSEQARKASSGLGWSGQSRQLLDFYRKVLRGRKQGWVYAVQEEVDD
ncbi:MAG TPA: glycosyltransferase family 1 protein [Bacillales bacterium]|nr:glycosyltransferase family 1 protein [Bacillales bacterium]